MINNPKEMMNWWARAYAHNYDVYEYILWIAAKKEQEYWDRFFTR